MANIRPVSYFQTDPRWKNVSYSTKYENTTIGASGCGPTAMAMVIATWKDPTVTPVTTCKWSVDHGYKATGNGTYHSYFVPQAAAYGLECERINSSSLANLNRAQSLPYHNKAHDYVDEGNLVICLMGPGNWTKGGHYILWYDNDGNDVIINDPASTKSTRERNTFELLMQQVRYYWVVKTPEEVISMQNSEVKALIEKSVSEQAAKIADQRIAAYVSSLQGSVPSDWAKDNWYSACVAGYLDGTNPKMFITREQMATLAVRNGNVKFTKAPDGFNFSAGVYK